MGSDELSTLVLANDLKAGNEWFEFELQVVEGLDSGASLRMTRESGRVFVGQSESCELRLSDPSVSRRHLGIDLVPGGLRVVDLGSTNGTFVDRLRVHDAVLYGEEMIQVGNTLLRVALRSAAPKGPPPATGFGALLGTSEAMRRIYPLCGRLAQTDLPVVIEGETGTGKEVLAESLHAEGPRNDQPFVVFDCTAIPPSLVESELFGHERGAFTGAVAARKGVFEVAHGGTLLIDEIGDLDPSLQPKLLRAIERLEVRRVGGDRWIRVNVRVIAATRRDLDREVQAGRFRDDLLHRLSVARVELPPLRRRIGDVEYLAQVFWQKLGGAPQALPRPLLARWVDYEWPGNVRELRNAVARFHALGEMAGMRQSSSSHEPRALGLELDELLKLPFVEARDRLLEDFERRYVERWMSAAGGDVGQAARASGIGKRYFQKIRARHR